MNPVFHPGECAVQTQAGVAHIADKVGNSIHREIPPVAREFLAAQPFAVLGAEASAEETEGKQSRVWASVISGPPGFLQATDAYTLEISAVLPSSDPLLSAFSRAEGGGTAVGLLAIEAQTRRRMRVNGRLTPLTDGSGYRLATEQVYANCPKYIQQRELVAEPLEAVSSGPAILSERLTPAQKEWISRTDTFFVASIHPEGGGDVSHRGGNGGFVRVSEDGGTLWWPDYPGNSLFNTLGNLALDPRAGLLLIDFETTGDLLQLTGRTRILWQEEAAGIGFSGVERAVEFTVEQIRETPGGLPLRYRFLEYSRFNPGS